MAKKYPLSSGSGMRQGFPRTDLSAFDDVDIQNPQPGDALVWNGTKWENAAMSSGGNSSLTFFLYDVAGSIVTFDKIAVTPSNTAGTTKIATVKLSTSPILLNKWVSAELNRSSIEGGVWNFELYGAVDIVADDTKFRINVSKIATAGGSETLLFTTDSETLESSVLHPVNVVSVQPSFGGFLATDKLKFDVYAVTTHATNVALSLAYGALMQQSRFDSPLIINHDDLPGINAPGSDKLHSAYDSDYKSMVVIS